MTQRFNHNKSFFICGLLLFHVFFLGCKVESEKNKIASKIQRPPNLVLIVADDLGYGDVGFHGCKDIATPNLDLLAKSGVTFTNGYVSWAACSPSRAGMLTGRYQDRFGFSRNPLFAPNDPNMGLPVDEETLPQILKKANYKSIVLGKWHLGAHPTQRPLERGFDDFFGFLTGGHSYFPEKWTVKDEYDVDSQYAAYNTKLLRNNDRVEETEYLTDALSREAVNYIKKYKNDPFFMYLAYNAPHAPLQASKKYLARFDHIKDKKRKTYAAMVSSVDDGVGRVLQQLDSLDLTENTMIVFLSDNGGPEHVNASDNGPLRGRKGQLFEGGIRVPFVISWPRKIKKGSTYTKPVISLDIFSTIIAQTGYDIRPKNSLDGVDLMPYLTNKNTGIPHETLYWQFYDRQEIALRYKDHKLIFAPDKKDLLFNLKSDVAEQQNLATTNDSVLKHLKKKHQKWKSEMKDAAFLGLLQDKEYDLTHPDRYKRPINKPL